MALLHQGFIKIKDVINIIDEIKIRRVSIKESSEAFEAVFCKKTQRNKIIVDIRREIF